MKRSACVLCFSLLLSTQLHARVVDIKSVEDYDQQLSSGRPTLVKFFAPWCGACVANQPAFDTLSQSPDLADVDFALINVDEQPQLSQRENINSIPTFVFLYKGTQVGTLVGAQDPATFETSMRQEIKARFSTTPPQNTLPQTEPGIWQSIKRGFTRVIDGITSFGSYLGTKIKNLFS